MEDFYKNLRDHPSLWQEHEVPKGSWKRFNQYRKKKDQQKRPLGFLPWLLGGLLVAMLMLNLHTFKKLRTVEHQVNTSTTDTVYITKYVTQDAANAYRDSLLIDQLRQTIIAQNSQLGNTNQRLTTLQYRIHALQDIIEHPDFITNALTAEEEESEIGKLSLDQAKAAELAEGLSPLNNQSKYAGPGVLIPSFTYSAESTWPNTPFALHAPITPDLPRQRISLLKRLTPKTFSLGLDLGYYYAPGFVTEEGQGLQTGLVVSSRFSQRVRGQLELLVNFLRGETNNISGNPNIPTVDPPQDGVLREVYVNQQTANAFLTFDYLLTKGKKWRPFVGLGYGMSLNQDPKFRFEFRTPNGEVYLTQENHRMHNTYHLLKANAGLEYQLLKRLDAQLNFSYQHFLNNNRDADLVLKTRLLYHF